MSNSVLKPFPDTVNTTSPGGGFRISDLPRIVFALYGVSLLPAEYNQRGNLGQMVRDGNRTLVAMASPNKVIGAAALKKARVQRDSLMGGWSNMLLLCWKIAPEIRQNKGVLNDARLDVQVIPRNVLNWLRQGGSVDQLRGRVCFASLRRSYLTIKPVTRTQFTSGAEELLIVTLDSYVPRLQEEMNCTKTGNQKLRALMDRGPLALIAQWGVDPNYDGRVFRAAWWGSRGNRKTHVGSPSVATQAVLTLPPQRDFRVVCVRSVDVFGSVSEVAITVAAPIAVRVDPESWDLL